MADALTFHAFEIDGFKKVDDPSTPLGASDDVLDVKVTPNRGHDCLSHRGIAKELSAILKIPLTHDPFLEKEAAETFNFSAAGLQGDATKSKVSAASVPVSVVIEDPALCSRYIAAYIKGVKVGPSPAWLVRNLESIGQRSINNVVDATNFVMFNVGQPLHAFDVQRLGSLDIGVRLAQEGEQLEALDKKVYTLKDSMLVITAGGRPAGIAGIKGGMADRIDETTRDIVIESATFSGVAIRKGSQALKLRTEASARFEQGLSPELAARGMQGMLEFVAHLIGGEVAGVVDVYPAPQAQRRVEVSVEKVNQILGTRLTGADVADAFVRLGFAYKEEGGVFNVAVPPERLDITIAEDLSEEVGRIVGYDKVPAVPLPPMPAPPQGNATFSAAERVRGELVVQGYSEVFTSVFAEAGERAVLNKVDSVRPYLRANLTDGLAEAVQKNIPNKDLLGLKEIKLFEIGTVWKGGVEEVVVATAGEKEKASEKPLTEWKTGDETKYDISYFPLSTTQRYKPFSKYPYIVRDIAAWVPGATEPADVLEILQKETGDLCVKASLFDQFQKGDKTSLAFRLIFQSFEKTLTEAEVNQIMEKVAAKLKEKGFEIR